MRRLALAFACAALATSAYAQEVIHRFDSQVAVGRDGQLTVTETIVVRAEGREIKRGIYRDFPLTFRDPENRRREVTFNLLGVERDGKPEPHFTRKNSNGIRIYAGSENVLLRRGDYTYTFRYQTGRQIRWFDGGAELYWNVTGNEWNFPIERANVRVTLEDRARPEKWIAYTGRFGARGKDWRGEIDANGDLRVETTRRLAPGEGFSVVAALPDGAVDEPSDSQKLWWLFLDYRSWFVAGFGLLLVLGYYIFAWGAVGRDPRGGTIIPLFHAPDGVSPALANYVHKWGLGRNLWRAFTAAALSLAVRGLILFDEKEGALTLQSTGKEPGDGRTSLPPGERAIFDWLRSKGGKVAIDRANGTAVAKIGTEFKAAVEKENKNKFFRKNVGYFIAGVALTACVIVGVLIFGSMREEEYFILFIMGFASVWLGAFLVPILTAIFGGRTARASFQKGLLAIAAVAVILFVGGRTAFELGAALVDAMPYFLRVFFENPFPFALVGAFGAVNGLFLYLLRAPTDVGREIMDKLEGLRLYLTTAEEARLNMNAPEITTERFEALLPYAVALDVEKPWAEAFQSALARANPGQTAPAYSPAWSGGRAWSGSSIGSAVSSSVAAATGAFASAVPASSSGSSGFSSGGGGGGSGGGGGGGGGGGW
jgi:uncharacterized membrane protein YgcG